MATLGLQHIALRTRDLKETERFYTRVLGFRIAFRVPPNMIFLRSPGSRDLLNFVKTTKRVAPAQGLDHFGFKVSKAALQQTEKILKQHMIALEGRRGRSAIYFLDPNGYRIEYYCD